MSVPRLTLLPRAGHPNNREGRDPASCGLTIEVVRGVSVLDAASDNGFLIATRCGGVADCKTCRVEVLPGHALDDGLSVMEDDERDALRDANAAPGARLSCQARVLADVTVLVPDPADMEEE